ncbi:hypothetical protein AB0O51_33710 [Streptomyces sp. NPDC090301]|uniref:hypothetical protein n=1 Tax=Streptomyces sp. NPDC090301 TaxID=3154975 RepID=UPI0034233542
MRARTPARRAERSGITGEYADPEPESDRYGTAESRPAAHHDTGTRHDAPAVAWAVSG